MLKIDVRIEISNLAAGRNLCEMRFYPNFTHTALLDDGVIFDRIRFDIEAMLKKLGNDTPDCIVNVNDREKIHPVCLSFETNLGLAFYINRINDILRGHLKHPVCQCFGVTLFTASPERLLAYPEFATIPYSAKTVLQQKLNTVVVVDTDSERQVQVIAKDAIAQNDFPEFHKLCRAVAKSLQQLGCLYGVGGRDYTQVPHNKNSDIKAHWDKVRNIAADITDRAMFELRLKRLVANVLVAPAPVIDIDNLEAAENNAGNKIICRP
jgi:hypothetical protein